MSGERRREYMSAENKALVQHYFEELWNRGNFGVIDSIVDPEYRGHDPQLEDMHGPDDLKGQVELVRDAFPDLRFEIEQQIAEADMVATRWMASATHGGEFLGIPPTGRRASVTGM